MWTTNLVWQSTGSVLNLHETLPRQPINVQKFQQLRMNLIHSCCHCRAFLHSQCSLPEKSSPKSSSSDSSMTCLLGSGVPQRVPSIILQFAAILLLKIWDWFENSIFLTLGTFRKEVQTTSSLLLLKVCQNSFVASLNSSHTRVFASMTTETAVHLTSWYLSAASGAKWANQFARTASSVVQPLLQLVFGCCHYSHRWPSNHNSEQPPLQLKLWTWPTQTQCPLLPLGPPRHVCCSSDL